MRRICWKLLLGYYVETHDFFVLCLVVGGRRWFPIDFHRTTECLRLEWISESIWSNPCSNGTPRGAKDHVQMVFGYLQGGDSEASLGSLFWCFIMSSALLSKWETCLRSWGTCTPKSEIRFYPIGFTMITVNSEQHWNKVASMVSSAWQPLKIQFE